MQFLCGCSMLAYAIVSTVLYFKTFRNGFCNVFALEESPILWVIILTGMLSNQLAAKPNLAIHIVCICVLILCADGLLETRDEKWDEAVHKPCFVLALISLFFNASHLYLLTINVVLITIGFSRQDEQPFILYLFKNPDHSMTFVPLYLTLLICNAIPMIS